MSEPPLPSDRNEPDTSLNQDRHVGVGRDVVESTIVTGDGNVVVHGDYIQAPSTPRSPSEQKLLNQVKAEVASRLRQSLHNAIFINLDKESQPQQVTRIWDAEVKVGEELAESLSKDTSIWQVFNQPEISGKLLILGKPGAGKTTTQLELAQTLVERSEQSPNHSIPVLFNLSSWQAEHQSINAWLVAELKSKYGVRRDISEKWLKECKLIPLLDGLDEVDSQQQEFCIQALNQLITGENAPLQVVVCSRLEEYERLRVQLRLNGAIYLRELTDRQIQAYLTSTHHPDLWQLLCQDRVLLTLLRIPLLLSITVLIYQQGALHDWQALRTSQERIQSLLNAFIDSRLEQVSTSALRKNNKDYSRQQTRQWLSWLAQQLDRETQTEFLIEKIQPSWLPNQRLLITYQHQVRLVTKLIAGLNAGLLTGPLAGLLVGLFSETSVGLSVGLSVALVAGLIAGLNVAPISELSGIAVTESLTWSWAAAKKMLRVGLIMGLRTGLHVILILGLFFALVAGLTTPLSGGLNSELITVLHAVLTLVLIIGLIVGLAVGLAVALGGGLLEGLRGSEVDQKSFPNQGIWKTLQTALVRVVGTLVTTGLVIGLVIGLSAGVLFSEPHLGLIMGLAAGLSVGLNSGLRAGMVMRGDLHDCIKHLVLRLVLYHNGYVPWNYAHFLNYCTDRLLLQRVGGRYRFMHKLLQEHFAAMPFEKP